MGEETTVKRLRIRTNAVDWEGLVADFGPHIGLDRVFVRTNKPLAMGTPIVLAIFYVNGSLALVGEGRVASMQGGGAVEHQGVTLAIRWSKESMSLAQKIVERAAQGHGEGRLTSDLVDTEDMTPVPERGAETEYARFAASLGGRDGVERPAISDLFNVEEILHKPATFELEWKLEGPTEWDKQSGEVMPLARIGLGRRQESLRAPSTPARGISALGSRSPGADPVALDLKDAVGWKGSSRALPARGRLVIGIDLGTTCACAAICENGQPRVIPSRRGTNSIPAVVMIYENGKTIVGEPAQRRMIFHPENTIVGMKRLIGRPFHSPSVQKALLASAYPIVEGDHGEAAVRVGNHRVSFEEISALVLKEIRDSVSLHVQEEVNRAVITCPAYYNERQRSAVRTAGELAGFHVERVLSEPIAAAMSYGLGAGEASDGAAVRRVFVYDLGGGTFDASLMDVKSDNFQVLATGGDTFLGGVDFDACVVQVLIERIRAQIDCDPGDDPLAMARLFQIAEQVKRQLSERHDTRIKIDRFVVHDSEPRAVEIAVSRAEVERLFEPLVERTLLVCLEVCARAGLPPDGVDHVLVVGGQSRAPLVRRRVREAFAKEPLGMVYAGEAVAIGAAMLGAALARAQTPVVIDTLPESIGIVLPDGRFKKLLERDLTLPAAAVHDVATTQDDQTEIEIPVLQGEDENILRNELIGMLVLRGIPPGPRGSVIVGVKFELTPECMLNITASDVRTGRSVQADLGAKRTDRSRTPSFARAEAQPGARAKNRHTSAEVSDDGLLGWLKRTLGSR